MGTVSLSQILESPLKRIPLDGGDVLHGMKCGDLGFVDFGEVYFSIIGEGAVKAWKKHLRMTLNLIVPFGMVKFVFMDDRGWFCEKIIGAERYVRLTVPPGIWFGFAGVHSPYSMVMNLADIPHDPTEIVRKDLADVPYYWGGG